MEQTPLRWENIAKAAGIMSIGLGDNANASKDYAMALGASSNANGTDSLALGRQSLASAANAIAMGAEAKLLKMRRLLALTRMRSGSPAALGDNASAGETNSIAIGQGSVADKVGSIALGSNSRSAGENAIALGNNSNAGGKTALLSVLAPPQMVITQSPLVQILPQVLTIPCL